MVRNEWADGLRGFTIDQIRRGLLVCRDNHNWPPSIAEFRDACQATADWEHKGQAYKISRKDRLIESDQSKKAKRANALEFSRKMKELGLK